jgi:hypothetical protein
VFYPKSLDRLVGEDVFQCSECEPPMFFSLPFRSSGSLAMIVNGLAFDSFRSGHGFVLGWSIPRAKRGASRRTLANAGSSNPKPF